jgi:hypothetical protein
MLENWILNALHELKFKFFFLNETACNYTFLKQVCGYNFSVAQTDTNVIGAASFLVSPGSNESE